MIDILVKSQIGNPEPGGPEPHPDYCWMDNGRRSCWHFPDGTSVCDAGFAVKNQIVVGVSRDKVPRPGKCKSAQKLHARVAELLKADIVEWFGGSVAVSPEGDSNG